ncbi:hypothetical protein [Microbacterium sp. NPDC056052]|uniref:hypothetical protein n=1 Tax=Microbacterium sp. NPDC056052 TaxID=3345695 RepID=UPI0035DB36F9
MTSTFTQQRADEIVAAVAQSDLTTFLSAVAFAPGVEPTAAAVAAVSFASDFRIDASTFIGGDTAGRVTATAGGDQAALALIVRDGAWKLDSTGSSAEITEARSNA